MPFKKFFFVIIVLAFSYSMIFSVDIGIRASPEVIFHEVITTENEDGDLKVAPGFCLNADINLFNIVAVGPTFNFFWISKNTTKTDYNAQLLDFGVSASAFYFPLSRLHLRGGVAGGAYTYSSAITNTSDLKENINYYNTWYKCFAEAGFLINPSLSVLAGASLYNHTMDSSIIKQYSPVGFRLGATLAIQYTFNTVKSDSITVVLVQNEPVFPLFAQIYKKNSFGTLTIYNEETAEIRNVSVSFRAGDYTASEMLCGTTDIIKKHKSIDLPFYADFSEEVLNFSEDGKILGEIVVTYELLGEKKTS